MPFTDHISALTHPTFAVPNLRQIDRAGVVCAAIGLSQNSKRVLAIVAGIILAGLLEGGKSGALVQ
jgi:hypothetical protein